MTVTTDPPTGTATASDPVPDPVSLDVRVLDAGAVLAEVVAQRRAAEAAEARVLMLAVHYVDLHPVTEEHPAASPAVGERLLIDRDPAPAGTPEAIAAESLAGEGTPGIAEYAVEELGAVLAVSYGSAYRLCGEAVAVCYRLPRLWARVHAGVVPGWQARMVARETRGLSAEAVGFVDRQVAILADRRRLPSLTKLRDLVHEARCRMDPDHERAVEETALGHRGVWFDPDLDRLGGDDHPDRGPGRLGRPGPGLGRHWRGTGSAGAGRHPGGRRAPRGRVGAARPPTTSPRPEPLRRRRHRHRPRHRADPRRRARHWHWHWHWHWH